MTLSVVTKWLLLLLTKLPSKIRVLLMSLTVLVENYLLSNYFACNMTKIDKNVMGFPLIIPKTTYWFEIRSWGKHAHYIKTLQMFKAKEICLEIDFQSNFLLHRFLSKTHSMNDKVKICKVLISCWKICEIIFEN